MSGTKRTPRAQQAPGAHMKGKAGPAPLARRLESSPGEPVGHARNGKAGAAAAGARRRALRQVGKNALDQLRAAGDVSTPVGDLNDLPDPLPLPPGQTPPSVALARS